MARFFSVLPLLLTLFLLAGCRNEQAEKQEKREANLTQAIAKTNELVAVLKEAKDEASVKASLPKIKSISDEIIKLKEAARQLGEPTPAQDKRLSEQFAPSIKASQDALAAELKRIVEDRKLVTKDFVATLQDARILPITTKR